MGGIMKKHVQRFFSILAIILFFVITYYMGRPLVAFVSEPGAFQAWVDAQGFVGVLLFLGMLVLQVFAAIIPTRSLCNFTVESPGVTKDAT